MMCRGVGVGCVGVLGAVVMDVGVLLFCFWCF